MIKRSHIKPLFFILILFFLTGCNEQKNPLLGKWQEISLQNDKKGKVIEFTPSTMKIDGHSVTVVYQIRDSKVRVSASKKAIIYEFENDKLIHYKDEQRGTVSLTRIY